MFVKQITKFIFTGDCCYVWYASVVWNYSMIYLILTVFCVSCYNHLFVF